MQCAVGRGGAITQVLCLLPRIATQETEWREASDSLCDDSEDRGNDDDNDDDDDDTPGDNDDSDDSLEDDHRPRRSHHHWEGEYDFMASQLVYNAHFTLLWRLPYMWWAQ